MDAAQTTVPSFQPRHRGSYPPPIRAPCCPHDLITDTCVGVGLSCLLSGNTAPFHWDHTTARFVLCYNPTSGGHAATALADWASARYGNDLVALKLGGRNEPGGVAAEALVSQLRGWRADPTVSAIRLLVGGGDGTVGWAISTLEGILEGSDLQLPPIALLPLGTGNELSRCLGWGNGSQPMELEGGVPASAVVGRTTTVDDFSRARSTAALVASLPSHPTVERFFQAAVLGEVGKLDRWVIEGRESAPNKNSDVAGDVSHDPAESVPSQPPSFTRQMLCFLSVGFDAGISHAFSEWRRAYPGVFSSVAVNKAGYAYLGVRTLLAPPPSIVDRLALEVDGRLIALPSTIRTIQVFNCHSSSDGIDFFGCGEPSVLGELSAFSAPSAYDGLLEVVGTEGVGHLMSTKLGFRHSHRLAQGREVRITVLEPSPSLVAQADGESWIPQGTLRVSASGSIDAVIGPAGRYPKA